MLPLAGAQPAGENVKFCQVTMTLMTRAAAQGHDTSRHKSYTCCLCVTKLSLFSVACNFPRHNERRHTSRGWSVNRGEIRRQLCGEWLELERQKKE